MDTKKDARHIVVIRRGQFCKWPCKMLRFLNFIPTFADYFDVIDSKNRPLLNEREILVNLKAIVTDADNTPPSEVAKSAVGVLTTENRKHWAQLRRMLESNSTNRQCLSVVDEALFVVCLDDSSPEGPAEMCNNFLCGTYQLTKTGPGSSGSVQTGTCTNRWYDKLQIIVCANGAAGINFEVSPFICTAARDSQYFNLSQHTGVDGHTVLRYAADIYTDNLLLMAKSISPQAPTLFKAKPSPHSKSSLKHGPGQFSQYRHERPESPPLQHPLVTLPRKLEWSLSSQLLVGIRFAETRLSDLICQNDVQVLEFSGFGKQWITQFGQLSPDAFIQMAFLAGYYGLYGRIECMYEPAMTKAFYHGRTEAIRSVQPESANFVKVCVHLLCNSNHPRS